MTNRPWCCSLATLNSSDSNSLCLQCGLCCNGVIFADVQLQADDDAARLKSLGLRFASSQKSNIKIQKFLQPCNAFDGCRCGIYSDRPRYCRDFECLLLKQVTQGRVSRSAAERLVRGARERVDRVKTLLHELGDVDESVALARRFRRVKARFEKEIPDKAVAARFGQLTLAMHELNMLLAEAFYPGD
jgi:Fe-S-cluster containining protein